MNKETLETLVEKEKLGFIYCYFFGGCYWRSTYKNISVFFDDARAIASDY